MTGVLVFMAAACAASYLAGLATDHVAPDIVDTIVHRWRIARCRRDNHRARRSLYRAMDRSRR